LKDIDNRDTVEDVLLDFSAAYIINHNLLLRKHMRNSCPHCGFRDIYLIERKGFSLMEASLHLHCLLFVVLGWVSVQHFVTSAVHEYI
jgi:hypothetical protein